MKYCAFSLSLSLIFFIICNVGSIGDHTFSHLLGMPDWCYTVKECNEATWTGACKFNGHQSPIDLPKDLSLIYHHHEDIHEFPKSDLSFPGFELDFRGHTVQLRPEGKSFKFSRVIDANYTVVYTLYAMDFHWGHRYNRGSEHTLDGRVFPAEVHLGFYDEKLFTPGDTEKMPKYTGEKDILVIGIFLDIASYEDVSKNISESNLLNGIVDKLNDRQNDHPISYQDEINLQDLFSGHVAYKYPGSFTTPQCREVEWWVLRKPVIVPLEHINAFRNATVDGLRVAGNNFRSIKVKHADDIGIIKFDYI